MVESGREYVLQWPGHAAYVTERFSGLLARQTLVDVTLICDEQKLRVHKLVLASCSLYFEEILAEDLGPEPVILLRDLNFSILKAMIEFMYCGETTVSHIHLPSLLSAARLFKVKELESLVEKMVGSHAQEEGGADYLSKDMNGGGRINGLMNGDDNGIRVSFSNKHNGPASGFDATESSDSESERNYIEENISDERCLYEEPRRNGEAKERPKLREKSVESVSDTSSTLDSEKEPCIYERYCDFASGGEERPQVYVSPERAEHEVNRVGQCSKVYTHKRRKANGESATLKRHAHFEKAQPQPLGSNRIDLVDESSGDDAPVTLKTNLENESPDYLLSFNSESIQSIVGCSLSDFCPSSAFDLLEARTCLDKEAAAAAAAEEAEAEGEEDRPPVLRRSVRLNQQESEETYAPRLRSKLRDDKKGRQAASGIKLLARAKRKNKELERRVPSVKVIVTGGPPAAASARKSRKSRKPHLAKSDKSKAPGGLEDGHQPCRPSNTTASVNRALWGDMSDVPEDGEIAEEFLEYSMSAEIPFAVGLLPLRAALERMQATLDHQPRKTRSSTKPEAPKRRGSPPGQQEVPSKKPCAADCVADEASAVCHIQIRTSPQCSRPRKRSLSDGAASLGQTAAAVSGRH